MGVCLAITCFRSIPLGLLFVVNIVVGWYGLKLVDVPTFLAIRRTTTVFTMAGEFFMLGIVPSSMVRLGVVVIVIGTIIAGWESLSSSLSGYLFTLANNILTAIQLNFARRFKDQTGVQGFGLVLYNGLTALPICLMLVLFQGEVAYVAAYPHLTNPAFLVSVIGASALGCFMTYIVLLCATVNSPLVTSVTGNVKDIASTVIGAVLFNDFVPTVLKVGGILLSFCGSGIFSYAKLTESSAAGRASTSAGATASAASVGTAAGTGIADGSVTHGAGYSGLSTPGGGALYDAHTADLDEDDYDDEDADRAVFAANGKSRYADGESASATVVDKPNSRKYHGQGGAV